MATRQEAYERNVALFKAGQLWEHGDDLFVLVEEPVNQPLYLYDDEGNGDYVDRLALRVESVPRRPDEPEGGRWIDESCFPYMRLVRDAPCSALQGEQPR